MCEISFPNLDVKLLTPLTGQCYHFGSDIEGPDPCASIRQNLGDNARAATGIEHIEAGYIAHQLQ